MPLERSVLGRILANQAQVGFMNQDGGVEGLARFLLVQLGCG